jgi:drug/metabolite transporter (DMT)-like permease
MERQVEVKSHLLKKIDNKYPAALVVFWGWIFTFLIHLPLSFLLGEKQVAFQPNHAWLWLLVYAVVNTVAFWLVIVGFRHVDASIGSLIGLLEVVFGVLFGALVFHEILSWTIYVGGAVILVAAMLPDLKNLIEHKRSKTSPIPVREI